MRIISLFLLSIMTLGVAAESVNNEKDTGSEVSTQAVNIKQSVLELNKDLYQLEQDLLSPATTRTALYFSLAKGKFYQPYSISITIDDSTHIQYLYTDKEVNVLKQGAIQPLDNINLSPGKHTIQAVVSGVNENGIETELKLMNVFEKNGKPLYLELKIKDNKKLKKAELKISQW